MKSFIAGVGVFCSYFDRVTLHGNAVHDNKDVGVFVDQTSSVTIEHNSVTSNCGNGVEASEVSHVSGDVTSLECVQKHTTYCTNSLQMDVHGNGVYENSEHGMVVRGRGDINFNDVFCNRKAALNFAQKSNEKQARN